METHTLIEQLEVQGTAPSRQELLIRMLSFETVSDRHQAWQEAVRGDEQTRSTLEQHVQALDAIPDMVYVAIDQAMAAVAFQVRPDLVQTYTVEKDIETVDPAVLRVLFTQHPELVEIISSNIASLCSAFHAPEYILDHHREQVLQAIAISVDHFLRTGEHLSPEDIQSAITERQRSETEFPGLSQATFHEHDFLREVLWDRGKISGTDSTIRANLNRFGIGNVVFLIRELQPDTGQVDPKDDVEAAFARQISLYNTVFAQTGWDQISRPKREQIQMQAERTPNPTTRLQEVMTLYPAHELHIVRDILSEAHLGDAFPQVTALEEATALHKLCNQIARTETYSQGVRQRAAVLAIAIEMEVRGIFANELQAALQLDHELFLIAEPQEQAATLSRLIHLLGVWDLPEHFARSTLREISTPVFYELIPAVLIHCTDNTVRESLGRLYIDHLLASGNSELHRQFDDFLVSAQQQLGHELQAIQAAITEGSITREELRAIEERLQEAGFPSDILGNQIPGRRGPSTINRRPLLEIQAILTRWQDDWDDESIVIYFAGAFLARQIAGT